MKPIVGVASLLILLLAAPVTGQVPKADQPPEDSPDAVSTEGVVLARKNTIGGWEIFAALQHEKGTDSYWIRLRANDLGNFRAKVLEIQSIQFDVDGHSFRVDCDPGEHAGRRLRGVGIVGDDATLHICAIEADDAVRFQGASKVTSRVTVAGENAQAANVEGESPGSLGRDLSTPEG